MIIDVFDHPFTNLKLWGYRVINQKFTVFFDGRTVDETRKSMRAFANYFRANEAPKAFSDDVVGIIDWPDTISDPPFGIEQIQEIVLKDTNYMILQEDPIFYITDEMVDAGITCFEEALEDVGGALLAALA